MNTYRFLLVDHTVHRVCLTNYQNNIHNLIGFNDYNIFRKFIRIKADTIYRRHRVRFRSDHHTHQHTHCQQNCHKHLTDGRQAQHTIGQDAYHLQALARRHSMQNHTKK